MRDQRTNAIDHAAADGMVTLTWESSEGEDYLIDASLDLTNWDIELDDGARADPGDQTTKAINLSFFGLESEDAVFIRVRPK